MSAGWDKVVKVWNLTRCNLRTNLIGHTGYVNTVTVSPDGSLCASGGKDGTAMLWDLNEGILVRLSSLSIYLFILKVNICLPLRPMILFTLWSSPLFVIGSVLQLPLTSKSGILVIYLIFLFKIYFSEYTFRVQATCFYPSP